MAWFFEGTGEQIGFSVSEAGDLSAYGSCAQLCRPQGGDPKNIDFIQGIEGYRSLHTPEASEAEYDGAGKGLKNFFAQNAGRAAAIIQYYKQDKQQKAAVGTSILMPSELAEKVFSLFKTIMGNPRYRYIITIDFFGLSVEEAPPNEIPKVADFVHHNFMSRRAYLSDSVKISVRGAS